MALHEIDRFGVEGGEGYQTTVIVYQNMISSRLLNGAVEQIAGLKEARTVDGLAVNCIDDDTYQIVNDPLNPMRIVRRVHP
ncbi:MAG: hypothetical protein HZA51_00005 [Planctomycetes bacterium]|nr:hypothetical protein [Planctomycetota bacterium]